MSIKFYTQPKIYTPKTNFWLRPSLHTYISKISGSENFRNIRMHEGRSQKFVLGVYIYIFWGGV